MLKIKIVIIISFEIFKNSVFLNIIILFNSFERINAKNGKINPVPIRICGPSERPKA